MDEAEAKRQGRIMALEVMVVSLYNTVLARAGASESQIRVEENTALDYFNMAPVLGLRPEYSDLLSSEAHMALTALFAQARASRQQE